MRDKLVARFRPSLPPGPERANQVVPATEAALWYSKLYHSADAYQSANPGRNRVNTAQRKSGSAGSAAAVAATQAFPPAGSAAAVAAEQAFQVAAQVGQCRERSNSSAGSAAQMGAVCGAISCARSQLATAAHPA